MMIKTVWRVEVMVTTVQTMEGGRSSKKVRKSENMKSHD